MGDLEHKTIVALAGRAWLDEEFDAAEDWEEAAASPVDQFIAVERLRAAMTTILPPCDDL